MYNPRQETLGETKQHSDLRVISSDHLA